MVTTIAVSPRTRVRFEALQRRARDEGRPYDADAVLRWLLERSAELDKMTAEEPA